VEARRGSRCALFVNHLVDAKVRGIRVANFAPFRPPRASSEARFTPLFVACAFGQTFEHIIQGKTADLLTRREFLEGREEPPDILLRRNEYEGVFGSPPRQRPEWGMKGRPGCQGRATAVLG
jgi:hypothetical protein